MVLPCKYEADAVAQVAPTINLLSKMDELHPDILRLHRIEPADYHGRLVFRSAVESIRGSYISTSTKTREALVRRVLEDLQTRGLIASFEQSGRSSRCDFTIALERNPDLFAAVEVKGGEGNSINISERPLWASEFGVWCHLDGAIVNPPAHGAYAIVNRLTNELVRRKKQVDVLFFKDVLCGTIARPCPKYVGRESAMGLATAPDVFLFPQRIPTEHDPTPPVHNLDTLRLPRLILELFGVDQDEMPKHVWTVQTGITELADGRLRRIVQVWHQGLLIRESASRPWRPLP